MVLCDAQYTSLHVVFVLDGDDLVGVKPVFVVQGFEFVGESLAQEVVVQDLEDGDDPGHEALDVERLRRWPVTSQRAGSPLEEGVETCGGLGIVGIDAHTEDDLVVGRTVGAVGEDAGNLDVSRFVGPAGIPNVHVVRPFDLDVQLLVDAICGIVPLDRLDNGDRRQVVDEGQWAHAHDARWVVDDCRHYQAARRRDPDVVATATTGYLASGCKREARLKFGHEVRVTSKRGQCLVMCVK